MPLYLFNRQDLRKYISQLYFLQSTGRRGTFSFYRKICKLAPILISGWFSKSFTFMLLALYDGTTAQLQICSSERNVPLLPSHRETLYPNQLLHKSVPSAKSQRLQITQLNSNLKENEQMKKLCRYSIIDNNKPKEKLARLGETWNHKSRMTVCATNWQMP